MARRASKLPDHTLRDLITKEIAIVNKNRWLTPDEKRVKVSELNKLLIKDEQ